MDLRKLAEPFAEADIEWRIDQVGKKQSGQIWARVVPYIQARAIMARLDEVCGPENWKVSYNEFEPAGGKPGVICSIAINVGADDEEDGTWVYKQDGAEQTDFEAVKGGFSGALKRAAVVWGIGRYLYSLEADFAETADHQKDKSWRYASDKTHGVFFWRPPALPAWAVPKRPAPEKETPPDPAASQSFSSAQPLATLSIRELAKVRGWSEQHISNYCQYTFGADPKSLTSTERRTLWDAINEYTPEVAMGSPRKQAANGVFQKSATHINDPREGIK